MIKDPVFRDYRTWGEWFLMKPEILPEAERKRRLLYWENRREQTDKYATALPWAQACYYCERYK